MENETLNNQSVTESQEIQNVQNTQDSNDNKDTTETVNTANTTNQESTHTAQKVSSPPPSKPTRNPRRVGTTTLGFCLVGLGIVLLMGFFMKDTSMLLLLKLSPVILIFLGCEILFYSLVSGREKMKYDGLSIFLCFILVLTSLGVSAGLQVAGAFGFSPERYITEQKMQNQLENKVCDALVGVENVTYVNTNFYTDVYFDYENAEVENLRDSGATCYVNVHLAGDYADARSFAQSVSTILQKLGSLTNQFESIRIENSNQKASFNFATDGRFIGELSVDSIEKMVQAEIYEEDTTDDTQSEVIEGQSEDPLSDVSSSSVETVSTAA